MQQTEIVNLEDLVSADHSYRGFMEVFDFSAAHLHIAGIEKDAHYKGFGAVRLFKCCLLQFLEDLSDRQGERFIRENLSARWFCGFGLSETTPDHTVLCRFRSRLGTDRLAKIFSVLRDQLKAKNLMNEVFTFVDASALIAKASLWEERDAAKQKKYETLNNEALPKVAHDKQARIGSKGKNKFWYGYKKHVSVDMQSGFINKIAVTPANITDAKGFKHICPRSGAAYGDKGYGVKPVVTETQRRGVHLAAIKKNNMKNKNRDLDRWLSGIRAPYERVFSKSNKRVRYAGIAKNQFAEFMNAICFNIKRLLVIDPPEICSAP